MPNPVAAIVGTGVLSTGASMYGANKADAAAKDATRAASAASAAELAFAKEQYYDWQETYGPIEDRLATYFEGLDPETYAISGLEAVEQERITAMNNLEANLARRGIDTSSLAANYYRDIEMSTATERARIITEAPQKVAEQQLGFLQVGLGQDPAGTVQNILSNTAANKARSAENAEAGAAQAWAAVGQSATSALSDYARYTVQSDLIKQMKS